MLWVVRPLSGTLMTHAELQRLYDEHAQALYAFLLGLTRCEADTKDLLQDVFVRLARSPECLQGVFSERGYLIRLAHNLVVDMARRRGVRERGGERLGAEVAGLFSKGPDEDSAAFREGLDHALGQLPEEQRAVVQLKLWEGLTFEAVAEALDISPNTAASRYRYGIDKLREVLRPLYSEIR